MIPSANTKSAIEAMNARFMSLFKSGNAPGLSEIYTTDSVIMPPNSNAISGRAGIAGFWQNVMNTGIKSVQLDTDTLVASGDLVCEHGNYTLFTDPGTDVDSGKFVVIWKREDDSWKLFWDVWNTSRPSE